VRFQSPAWRSNSCVVTNRPFYLHRVQVINGMPEHVHLVLSIPSMLAIAELVKRVKGVSSHFVNETFKPEFKWQDSWIGS
jgi:REP element-mobilizing transposase RayT